MRLHVFFRQPPLMRNRFKRNERLYQIALRSDWTFSAKLAAGGLAIGVFLIPTILIGTGDPDLQPLAGVVRFLGAVFTVAFIGIGIRRYLVQRKQAAQPPADGDKSE